MGEEILRIGGSIALDAAPSVKEDTYFGHLEWVRSDELVDEGSATLGNGSVEETPG